MTTIPQPYLHDATAHVWADRIKDISREDLLDLASGLLSVIEGILGQHWNEADSLVKEYRPHLDQVTRGLDLSPDVHAVLATAQQASLDLHSEAGTMKVIGLLQGLAESLKLNASKGGKTKAMNSGKEAAKAAIREIWASGKYSTKQRCAEEEYQALGIGYETALKALRNAPGTRAAASTG